jgi:hypothetical protein
MVPSFVTKRAGLVRGGELKSPLYFSRADSESGKAICIGNYASADSKWLNRAVRARLAAGNILSEKASKSEAMLQFQRAPKKKPLEEVLLQPRIDSGLIRLGVRLSARSLI